MLWIFVAIVGYSLLLLYYYLGGKRIFAGKRNKEIAKTTFSVVIPFRNEAKNLPTLLASLQQLAYPKPLYEIIFVNDASEDASVAIIKEWINTNQLESNTVVLESKRNSASPKKDAIHTAVLAANYQWIITTDADCVLPASWLSAFDSCAQENKTAFIAGPVLYQGQKKLLDQFQILDGLSLQAITMGGFGWKKPILANGANMAYLRNTFLELEGFSGNDHIASGDDIFMLEKVYNHDSAVLQYLNNTDAIVKTKVQPDWFGVINQRIRWAAKTGKQKRITPKLIGFLVLFVNLIVVVSPFVLLLNPSEDRVIVLLILGIKMVVDYLFLSSSANRFNAAISLPYFFLSFWLYPCVFLIVLIGSVVSKYSWKGRSYKS